MKRLTILLVAVGLVFVFTVPVPAEDKTIEDRVKALEQSIGSWTIYGSARYQTFYNDRDLNADSDDKDLRWDSAANARLGGKVIKDKITGVYEVGLDDDSPASGGSGVYTRLIYGTYDFGAGTVTFGQDWTPIGSMFYSNQVVLDDNDLLGWGAIYETRTPQIKFKMKGLEIALVEDKASSDLNADTGDVDVFMPKFEVRYHVDQEKFFADVFGGFFSYGVEEIVMGGVNYGDETVNAWTAGIGGGLKLDPIFIRAQVYYAQNARNFNLAHTDGIGAKFDATGDVVDEENFGAHFVAGTKIDKYTVEAGVGYVSSEYDESGSDKNTAMSYYMNVTVPVYGPFIVVPEVGVLDYGDGSDGKDEKKDTTYFGAKWQISF